MVLLMPAFSRGQVAWLKEKAGIEPFGMVQLWTTYTQGTEVYDTSSGAYIPVDNRLEITFRRARFGFKSNPYPGLRTFLAVAYELIGRDVYSGIISGTNNGARPALQIWDAFVQWQVFSSSEALYLTGGYFRPQISRESITSGWSVNSMDKAPTQVYIRQHLVGHNPGRAMGLNLGGLLANQHLQYNVGVFTPLYHSLKGNSTGTDFSPLLTGRIAASLGDPEQERYGINYDINYFGNRKGLTLAFAGAWQGPTALFEENYALSADLLLNWGALNLDGEWNWMWRDEARAASGHIRAGFNLPMKGKSVLEPVLMTALFQGATAGPEQAAAADAGMPSGTDQTFSGGLNWYLNQKKLKVLLHYTWYRGEAGDAGEGAGVNQYFFQAPVGPIRRGNWLGLGLNAIF